MSILSDRDIRRYILRTWIRVDPLDESQIQPASIDLKLAGEFRSYPFQIPVEDLAIDLNDKMSSTVRIEENKYVLQPDEFILGSTEEYVEIPDNLCARVEGKSSLGRLGLLIHATAGYIDPGFRGKITLEIKNLNNRPIILRAGKPVCQLSFTELSSPAARPYGHKDLNSKYQDQREVQDSLYQG